MVIHLPIGQVIIFAEDSVTPRIIEFEKQNPAVSLETETGTEEEELMLPPTLRAVIELQSDDRDFIQEIPDAEGNGTDSAYCQYGYVAPDGAEEKYKNNETVIYTIHYAGETGTQENGEKAYRVYGSVNGGEPCWFACDEKGQILGEIREIAVVWTAEETYHADQTGEYVFRAEAEEYVWNGEKPRAVVTVKDSEEGDVHKDEEPQESPDTPTVYAVDRMDGGGANGEKMKADMEANTPTSGSDQWISYLNTLWREKALKVFEWTQTDETGAYKGWVWSGAAASGNGGNPGSDPLCIPAKSGNTWEIYSGEQLRYALLNCQKGDIISVMGNIDLNGDVVNWEPVINLQGGGFEDSRVILQGNGNTIYNLGTYVEKVQTLGTSGGIWNESAGMIRFGQVEIHDLNFVTAAVVNSDPDYAGASLFGACDVEISNVSVERSLFFSERIDNGVGVAAFSGNAGEYKINDYITEYIEDSVVTSCFFFGGRHVGSISGITNGVRVENTIAADNILVSRSQHSGSFISCTDTGVIGTNCVSSNNQLYCKTQGGGFIGYDGTEAATGDGSILTDCFSSGIIEGETEAGGFTGTPEPLHGDIEYRNCYSTTLVGLRTIGDNLGGFIGKISKLGQMAGTLKLDSCYAAGETGNYTTDMDAPEDTGGFISEIDLGDSRLETVNCYYDKQTTAMREWTAGNIKEISGVTGVLTTDRKDSQQMVVSGLTSPPGDRGFTGFSSDADWVYEEGQYPQLAVLANADASQWGSEERADLVRACSLASTGTVFLNTWEKGFDWDGYGVRTEEQVSYDRTLESTGKTDHKGNQYTYDTVREITTDFTVSYDTAWKMYWEELIEGGAPAKVDGVPTKDTVQISGENGKTVNPGLNWYKDHAEQGGQAASRPIRLISYMQIDAGEDAVVRSGETYNHRENVGLKMMDTLTPDLVVGLDDEEIWSTAKGGTYPDSSKYYEVVTDNMETGFSASEDAWLYTEVWRARQDADGSYVQAGENEAGYSDGENMLVPDVSVKVTGSGTGEGTTLTEKKWNGELAFYPDTSKERKYIVSYYWMLSDGRYCTDYKIVTIKPGEYDLTVTVRDMKNGDKSDPINPQSLYLGTGTDNGTQTGYVLGQTPSGRETTTGIAYTKNSAAGWKKRGAGTEIVKTQIDFHADDTGGTLMGTAFMDGEPEAGDTITIPTTYYYTRQTDGAEETKSQALDITYQVREGPDGELCLRFNKLANAPADEFASALEGENDSTGIPREAEAYINDMQFNVEITLWVKSGKMDFGFTKVDEEGVAFGNGGAEFTLYGCGHIHDSSCGGLSDPEQCTHQHSELADSTQSGNCWTEIVQTASVGEAGKVEFTALETGEYMLAETKTKPGYQLPKGQWLLTVDSVAQTIDITERADGTVKPPAFKNVGNTDDVELELPNYREAELPSFGSGGIVMFILLGAVLMTGSLIGVIYCRKKYKEEVL